MSYTNKKRENGKLKIQHSSLTFPSQLLKFPILFSIANRNNAFSRAPTPFCGLETTPNKETYKEKEKL